MTTTSTCPVCAHTFPHAASEIAQFLHHLAHTHPPTHSGNPADHAALLARKADLLTRIANQHDTLTHPEQARHITKHARAQAAAATRHTENPETDDTTNVKDLTSPTSPKQGILLSTTAEFRRASSPFGGRAVDVTLETFAWTRCLPGSLSQPPIRWIACSRFPKSTGTSDTETLTIYWLSAPRSDAHFLGTPCICRPW